MKTAVVGSRNLNVKFIRYYIPAATSEIVSGGAKGVDAFAKKYAEEMNCKYTEFLPDYEKYGRVAPLRRNDEIIDYADIVVAIWDGKSKGTKYVIDKCKKIGKSLIVCSLKLLKDINLLINDSCDYCNMTALGNEMLKKIISAELDREMYLEVDTKLINVCIKAILTNKSDFKFDPALNEIITGYEDNNEDMLIEVSDKYCEI